MRSLHRDRRLAAAGNPHDHQRAVRRFHPFENCLEQPGSSCETFGAFPRNPQELRPPSQALTVPGRIVSLGRGGRGRWGCCYRSGRVGATPSSTAWPCGRRKPGALRRDCNGRRLSSSMTVRRVDGPGHRSTGRRAPVCCASIPTRPKWSAAAPTAASSHPDHRGWFDRRRRRSASREATPPSQRTPIYSRSAGVRPVFEPAGTVRKPGAALGDTAVRDFHSTGRGFAGPAPHRRSGCRSGRRRVQPTRISMSAQ